MWNCTHLRHPTDEQLWQLDIYMLKKTGLHGDLMPYVNKKINQIPKTYTDPDVTRTRSLLIWSQTRYHCATESTLLFLNLLFFPLLKYTVIMPSWVVGVLHFEHVLSPVTKSHGFCIMTYSVDGFSTINIAATFISSQSFALICTESFCFEFSANLNLLLKFYLSNFGSRGDPEKKPTD